jgi:hypothetical protein
VVVPYIVSFLFIRRSWAFTLTLADDHTRVSELLRDMEAFSLGNLLVSKSPDWSETTAATEFPTHFSVPTKPVGQVDRRMQRVIALLSKENGSDWFRIKPICPAGLEELSSQESLRSVNFEPAKVQSQNYLLSVLLGDNYVIPKNRYETPELLRHTGSCDREEDERFKLEGKTVAHTTKLVEREKDPPFIQLSFGTTAVLHKMEPFLVE